MNIETLAQRAIANGDGQVAKVQTRPQPKQLGDKAYHGLAGDIVRTVSPHTEADSVALLMQFLVAFGSCVGRGPHYQVEGDQHHANLYAVLVGDTAKARKGTSWGRIRQLFDLVADPWCRDRVQSGLSSGEGLIWAVRDAVSESDPGVNDKRLMVLESEFANILRVIGREGNTLSRVVRDGWDKGDLATMTKNAPAKATGAHISIVGHITGEELRRYLDRTELANGFANRFMFLCVKRSKVLPHGGNLDDAGLQPLAKRLDAAIRKARTLSRVTMTDDASEVWTAVYPELSEGGNGLIGHLTARAEAHVVRLATVYALVDGVSRIETYHLYAALELWKYAEASAEHIFGVSTGDVVGDRILAALADQPEMTRTDINNLFHRNQSKERIQVALEVLESGRQVRREKRETSGRAAEVWCRA